MYICFFVSVAGEGEVRCFCNQPECVTQGYLCRGRGCFTELPSDLNPSLIRPERSPWHGCLGDGFKERQCPTGLLCCEQDLCNHVDDPAVRTKLNKTLQGQYLFGKYQLDLVYLTTAILYSSLSSYTQREREFTRNRIHTILRMRGMTSNNPTFDHYCACVEFNNDHFRLLGL